MLLRGAGFFAGLLDFAALLRELVFAEVAPDFALLPVERFAADVLLLEDFGLVLEVEDREPPLLPPVDEPPSSIDHLPDMTRWAASATASAISEPSLVALDITDFAALSAVSAASIPASLIALRAFGLAAIAAAAAVRPAASISLLIAALASLSTVGLLEREDEDFEELVRLVDLAIADLPFRIAH